jgi:hypothetical protein
VIPRHGKGISKIWRFGDTLDCILILQHFKFIAD